MPRSALFPRHRVAGAVLAAGSLLLAGCGGVPDRTAYIDKVVESVGIEDMLGPLAARGVDEKTATSIVRTYAGCQYDALTSNVELLEKSFDDPTDPTLTADIDAVTGACVNDMAIAMNEAATPTTMPMTTVPSFETIPGTIPETVPNTVPDTSLDTSLDTIPETVPESIPDASIEGSP